MKEQKPQTKAFHFCDYCANKAVELVEQARADERAKILKEVLKRHDGEYDKYDPTPNQFIPWLEAELKKLEGKHGNKV